MTIQEVLNEYKFNNVGQFKCIAKSLGYKEEYNKGYLCFSLKDDKLHTTVEGIRSYTKGGQDLTAEYASMERVCKFFDKEQINSSDYAESLSDKGIDIMNWGDLRGDSKDRFTIIDHTNKICYTGKEFYNYALQNCYLLDGKGTKLDRGVLSDMTEVKGKPAKIRMTEKGTSIFYKKEALVIPNKILGKKLSEQQKKSLLDGDMIMLPAKKGHVFVQVDQELNSVIVRSEKELSIPTMIGDKELTAADKYLLANGHSLDNMILHGPEGYFIADVSMNSDRKGYAFANIQNISVTKARELIEKQKENNVVHTVETEKEQMNVQESRNMAAELKEAIAKDDYEKMAKLKDEGYKPSEEVINGLSQNSNIDEKKAVVIEKLFGTKPEVQKAEELSPAQEEVKVEETKVIIQSVTPELDVAFKSAIENSDFAGLSLMKTEGYQPSKEVMQSLSASVPGNTLVAVQKIFGLKTTAKTLGDVKLAQSQPSNNKELSRGIGNAVNKAFGDL